MPSVESVNFPVTWEFILQVIALVLAIGAGVVTIVKALEAITKYSVRKKVKDLETRMDAVEERLILGDKRFEAQSDDLGQVLVSMHAIVMHMISGNDKDKLQATEKEMTEYMAKRKTKREE
jgi:hypothetical protein